MFLGSEKKKNATGYLFNGVYWKNIGENMCLIRKDNFEKLYKYYITQLNLALDNNEIDQKKLKLLQKQLLDLDKNITRVNISKIIRDQHYQDESSITWNADNNLFVFENAIYDLSKGEFIKPIPEQFINFSCGYNYEDGEYLEETQDINDFIDSILNLETLNTEKPYIMKVLASFLRQCNIEEKAYFLTGIGRNGKGTLTTLLNNVLGKYWGELRIEYYTTYEHGANSQQQNLYDCQYSRVLNTSEIAENNQFGKRLTFIEDKFKRITGGDTISARKCGSPDTVDFKAGKVLIQTNTLPKFTKISLSLQERIIVINFPYTFTDNEKLLSSDSTQFKPIDRNLKEKFYTNVYKNAFIKLLFKYYKEYIKEKLTAPESIINYTNSYFLDSSKVSKWFFDNYKYRYEGIEAPKKITKSMWSRISISDIVSEYNTDNDNIENNITSKKFLELLKTENLEFYSTYVKRSTTTYDIIEWVKKTEEDKKRDAGEDDEDDEEN